MELQNHPQQDKYTMEPGASRVVKFIAAILSVYQYCLRKKLFGQKQYWVKTFFDQKEYFGRKIFDKKF